MQMILTTIKVTNTEKKEKILTTTNTTKICNHLTKIIVELFCLKQSFINKIDFFPQIDKTLSICLGYYGKDKSEQIYYYYDFKNIENIYFDILESVKV